MTVIHNNNFARDNYYTREERLNKIEQFYPEIASIFDAPSQLNDWALNCHQITESIMSDFWDKTDLLESVVSVVQDLTEKLGIEYQLARSFIVSNHRPNAILLKDFAIDAPFPRKRAEKIQRVERLIETNRYYIENGMGEIVPELIINRILAILNELNEKIILMEKRKIELNQKSLAWKERFKYDSMMLSQFYSWFKVIFGKDDYRFTTFGLVKPKKTRRGKQIMTPTNLNYERMRLEISWDAVEIATSYELVAKKDAENAEFESIYAGKEEKFTMNQPKGNYFVKVRARNKHGFGEWSEEIEVEV